MAIKVELKPELEAELRTEAREKGLSLEVYVAQLLHERRRVRRRRQAHAEQRARAFESWARSRPISDPLSDHAIRREHLVRDAR
jgi:hypothetical protein